MRIQYHILELLILIETDFIFFFLASVHINFEHAPNSKI